MKRIFYIHFSRSTFRSASFSLLFLCVHTLVFATYPAKKSANGFYIGQYRIGLGCGINIYMGAQRDFGIAYSYLNRTELIPGFNFELYKTINSSSEIGIRFAHGSMFTTALLSDNKTY